MGFSQPNINNLESNERDGSITLKSLGKAAEALGCRVVYGLVPVSDLKTVVRERARAIAEEVVSSTVVNMELEGENISKTNQKSMRKEIEEKLIRELPSRLWDTK